MANFRTHITVAAGGGALLAYTGFSAGWWSPLQALTACGLTAFGGILPDIDADHSRSNRLIFTLLGILAAVLGAALLPPWLDPPALLLPACAGVYLGVRYLAGPLFSRLTVHRGGWHSLLAAVLCALAATALSHQFFAVSARLAWSHGIAVLAGFLIHLLLDEIYSVDLSGGRLKRSFGTALKLADFHRPGASLVMLAATAALTLWLPPMAVLASLLAQDVGW